jgi:hypothetical protein
MASKEKSAPPVASTGALFKDLKFIWKKETKGTHCYQQMDEQGAETTTPIGTLYLRKDSLGDKKPAAFLLTIIPTS